MYVTGRYFLLKKNLELLVYLLKMFFEWFQSKRAEFLASSGIALTRKITDVFKEYRKRPVACNEPWDLWHFSQPV